MSTLESDLEENSHIEGGIFGLCGYGSGAKAKVFEAIVQPGWREVVSRWNLFERLAGRIAIDHLTYENLHKGIQQNSVIPPTEEFALVDISEDQAYEGQRTYKWISKNK